MKPLCLKKHQLKALNFIIVLILLTMPPNDCFGQCLDLVITEVGIKPLGGPQGQESREFIELHNATTSPIDVAGYWLRTDQNNNITSPIFADVEIVDWTTRRPNNIPNDLVVGPLTLNSTHLLSRHRNLQVIGCYRPDIMYRLNLLIGLAILLP